MPLNSLLQAFRSKKRTPHSTLPRLRIAVIGAGRMGQFHIKAISQSSAAELVAIADISGDRLIPLARQYKVAGVLDLEELFQTTDAAIIAAPTPAHFEIGKILLGAGISCLIEKPMTETLEQADDLITLAEKKKCILQVGHIERFNPAVIEAARHIKDPQFIEVNRLGPYDPRVAHIGVVMDLMIHDLDIILFLVGRPVTRVEAFGAKVLSSHEDIAKVRLYFEGGCVADLSASRISLKKYRRIRIFQKNAYMSLDYAAPELKVYRKKSEVVKSLSDISILTPKLTKKDPLELELEHFVECVQKGKTPLVSGRHGRDALALAREVLANLKIQA
jgi:predicted dehydrogenase